MFVVIDMWLVGIMWGSEWHHWHGQYSQFSERACRAARWFGLVTLGRSFQREHIMDVRGIHFHAELEVQQICSHAFLKK